MSGLPGAAQPHFLSLLCRETGAKRSRTVLVDRFSSHTIDSGPHSGHFSSHTIDSGPPEMKMPVLRHRLGPRSIGRGKIQLLVCKASQSACDGGVHLESIIHRRARLAPQPLHFFDGLCVSPSPQFFTISDSTLGPPGLSTPHYYPSGLGRPAQPNT